MINYRKIFFALFIVIAVAVVGYLYYTNNFSEETLSKYGSSR